MPLPESPQTREEMYLNGIATGSTDGLPDAPVTREEMYLDYIAKNGGGGGGGSSTLSGLTDVDISNPTDGQTLVYNAATEKWVNGSAGGGGLVIKITEDSDDIVLDKTFSEIWAAFTSAQPCAVVDDRDPDAIRAYPILSMSLSDLEVEISIYVFSASSANDYPMYNDNVE